MPSLAETCWLPREDARLKELWALGLSLADIARRLGRSAAACAKRAHALGLPARERKHRVHIRTERGRGPGRPPLPGAGPDGRPWWWRQKKGAGGAA